MNLLYRYPMPVLISTIPKNLVKITREDIDDDKLRIRLQSGPNSKMKVDDISLLKRNYVKNPDILYKILDIIISTVCNNEADNNKLYDMIEKKLINNDLTKLYKDIYIYFNNKSPIFTKEYIIYIINTLKSNKNLVCSKYKSNQKFGIQIFNNKYIKFLDNNIKDNLSDIINSKYKYIGDINNINYDFCIMWIKKREDIKESILNINDDIDIKNAIDTIISNIVELLYPLEMYLINKLYYPLYLKYKKK